MQLFAQALLTILDTLHAEMARAIDGLPQAALDWTPGPDMNSIAALVAHVVGAERYWLGDVVARVPSSRDRPAEFRTSGLDSDALKDWLATATAYAHNVFAQLTLDDLEAVRTSPRDGRQFALAWCLGHVLEHTALHTGHIQLTRQLWEQHG